MKCHTCGSDKFHSAADGGFWCTVCCAHSSWGTRYLDQYGRQKFGKCSPVPDKPIVPKRGVGRPRKWKDDAQRMAIARNHERETRDELRGLLSLLRRGYLIPADETGRETDAELLRRVCRYIQTQKYEEDKRQLDIYDFLGDKSDLPEIGKL